jgi:hypothetical protein
MFDNVFTITPLDVITWITFGFVTGIIVHFLKPFPSAHVGQDIMLAVFGSIVGGLTIVFFYGYLLLGTLTISIVGGIILSTIYIALNMHKSPIQPRAHNNDQHLIPR